MKEMNEEWMEIPVKQTDWRTGLSRDEVMVRMENGLGNEPVDSASKTVGQIVRENVLTYFNLIFLILSVLLIIVGSFRNLTFLPVILVNTGIGIFQEIRARNVLDKMTMMTAP